MPHKNDMTLWDEIGCQRGCHTHPMRMTRVTLEGQTKYRDRTPIPERFTQHFKMSVWDTEQTPVDGGPYCPARDAVSETIWSHGVWEPTETAVMLMCFEAIGEDAWFIDFGCQIGWYSILAARQGLRVLAIDADADCVAVTDMNMSTNATQPYIMDHSRIAADTAPIAREDDAPIVVKIDVEGAEEHAVSMLRNVIDWVQFALIEISPVFNASYPALVEEMLMQGFELYEIPPPSTPPVVLERLTDLRPFHLDDDAIAEIPAWHQKNVLFVRGGL